MDKDTNKLLTADVDIPIITDFLGMKIKAC